MMIVSVAMAIIISNSQTSIFSCNRKPPSQKAGRSVANPCYNIPKGNRILYSTIGLIA